MNRAGPLEAAVDQMHGSTALPRTNGELVFEAPWQGRAFGLAVGVVRALDLEWDVFRQRLIAAIDEAPERAYYESWLGALESLVTDAGLVDAEAIEMRMVQDAEADHHPAHRPV